MRNKCLECNSNQFVKNKNLTICKDCGLVQTKQKEFDLALSNIKNPEIFKSELKRICGCISLPNNIEEKAINELEQSVNPSIKEVFLALKRSLESHSYSLDLEYLANKSGYQIEEIKKYINPKKLLKT